MSRFCSKSRSLILPTYTPALPREFASTHKAVGLTSTNNMENHRSGGGGNIISLGNITMSAKQAFVVTAQKQKKEILEWLSLENPPPTEILLRLSKSSTPYSKLLSEALEELGYVHAQTRSQKIDDLERESALTSAKTEVEIQQQQEKLIRAKNERSTLTDKIKKTTVKLDKINKDVELLQSLSVYEGIDKGAEEAPKEVILKEAELEKKTPQLDENEYKVLWGQRQDLLDQIESLKELLKDTQDKQIKEIQKYSQMKAKGTAPYGSKANLLKF